MIQDIAPYSFSNQYINCEAAATDTLLCFDGDKALLRETAKGIVFPRVGELSLPPEGLIYLFELANERYFLAPPAFKPMDTAGFIWHDIVHFRTDRPRHLAFAGVTGGQLYRWYRAHKLCGACGTVMTYGITERSLICPACGGLLYPQLSPALIIAITDGDRLLLTRYANRPYRRWALVAGYVEIGETVEDALRREVMEEVGIRVRNLRYYKSQPWSFSDSLLLGFYCDAEDSGVQPDGEELAEAVWFCREELPPSDIDISLTSEMIEAFRSSKYPR